ncbi:MAG: ABC transporter permease [Acidobacteria bacterium]|nr:ABC transporter permease [Acidobacteriota bacterium]
MTQPSVRRAPGKRTFAWLESLWQDAVFGTRALARNKIFTAVAWITLALGIGANTAIFTLLNGLLWRGLPVRQPDQLVRVRVTNLPPTERAWVGGRATAPKERTRIPFPLFEALGRLPQVFDGVFGIAGQGPVVVELGGASHRLEMSTVTGSYFPVLGIQPAAGRLLAPDDDVPGGPPGGWGVVIGDGVWTRLFGRGADAVGTRITLERVPFTIVGVAPAGFHGIHPGVDTEIWLPVSAFEAMYPKWRWRAEPGVWMLQALARLKPGVTVEQARRQMAAMSRPLLEQVKTPGLRGEDEKHFLAMRLDVVSARSGFSWLAETFGPALRTLMAAVAAVLLIAATNLTNLLLARSTARRREIAVRLALGAPAGRIRRQLLVESALLAIAGAGAGIVLAGWFMTALIHAVSGMGTPIQLETPVDWNVLGFLTLVLAAVVLVAGWVPAWSAVRGEIHQGTQQRTNSKLVARLRGGLVVVQIAFSLTLLGGAGLLLVSLESLLREPTGFNSAQTVFLAPDLVSAGVGRERMPAAYGSLLEEARRQPGVRAAAWTLHMPLTGGLQAFTIEFPGHQAVPLADRMVFSHQVTDGYFDSLGIPLVAGHDFPPRGSAGPKSSIVSENLARKFFGNPEAALGQPLKPGSLDWTRIVGVASDAKFQHVREPNPLTVYTSYWDQRTTLGMTLVVRHGGSREALLSGLQAGFKREAGRMPFTRVRTIGENVASLVATERILTALLSGFALFALLISATGIAGLLGYAVQLRRREIGIRIALGATPSLITRQFQKYALGLALAGLALGGLLSFWLRRAVDVYLFRVGAANFAVWLSVSALVLLCAAAATAIPTRQAARLDPIQALRTE